MNRKFIVTLFIVIVIVVTVTTTSIADFSSGGSVVKTDQYWYYNTQERYEGEPYDTTLGGMAGRRLYVCGVIDAIDPDMDSTYTTVCHIIDRFKPERYQAVREEFGTPRKLTVFADDRMDAEEQIAEAVEYAPEFIEIKFINTAEAIRFAFRYSRWQTLGMSDALVGAVWTRTEEPFTVSRTENIVTLHIPRYADGWLAYVDTKSFIKCYESADYSRKLVDFRVAHSLFPSDIAEGERARLALEAVLANVEYDWDDLSGMETSDYRQYNPVSHTVRGMVEEQKAVCDGLTASYQFAAACLGIKSFDVVAWGDYGNHSWVKVLVDGKWYNVDPTRCLWNDKCIWDDYTLVADKDVVGTYRNYSEWIRTLYRSEVRYEI